MPWRQPGRDIALPERTVTLGLDPRVHPGFPPERTGAWMPGTGPGMTVIMYGAGYGALFGREAVEPGLVGQPRERRADLTARQHINVCSS